MFLFHCRTACYATNKRRIDPETLRETKKKIMICVYSECVQFLTLSPLRVTDTVARLIFEIYGYRLLNCPLSVVSVTSLAFRPSRKESSIFVNNFLAIASLI